VETSSDSPRPQKGEIILTTEKYLQGGRFCYKNTKDRKEIEDMKSKERCEFARSRRERTISYCDERVYYGSFR